MEIEFQPLPAIGIQMVMVNGAFWGTVIPKWDPDRYQLFEVWKWENGCMRLVNSTTFMRRVRYIIESDL